MLKIQQNPLFFPSVTPTPNQKLWEKLMEAGIWLRSRVPWAGCEFPGAFPGGHNALPEHSQGFSCCCTMVGMGSSAPRARPGLTFPLPGLPDPTGAAVGGRSCRNPKRFQAKFHPRGIVSQLLEEGRGSVMDFQVFQPPQSLLCSLSFPRLRGNWDIPEGFNLGHLQGSGRNPILFFPPGKTPNISTLWPLWINLEQPNPIKFGFDLGILLLFQH